MEWYWYAILAYIAYTLLAYFVFGALLDGPRIGWSRWWQIERRESSGVVAPAAVVLVVFILWLVIPTMPLEGWKQRRGLRKHFELEECRLGIRTNGNHA